MPVPVPDAFAWSPGLWLRWARSGLVPGEFDFVQPSLGVLTHSGLFVDLLELFARSCACAHVSDASVLSLGFFGSPDARTALLVGKFGVTDAFADRFEFPHRSARVYVDADRVRVALEPIRLA